MITVASRAPPWAGDSDTQLLSLAEMLISQKRILLFLLELYALFNQNMGSVSPLFNYESDFVQIQFNSSDIVIV